MNEEKIVKSQLAKNRLFNILTFSIILIALGLMIYGEFKNSLYISADTELKKELNQGKRMILPEKKFEEKKEFIQEGNISDFDKNKKIDENIPREIENNEFSPRVVTILRDSSGNIIEEPINEIYEQAEFNMNELEEIYELKINGYSYRGINYKLEDGTYRQALINVDSEISIEQKFIKTLIMALVISIAIILVASFGLSRLTLKPIVDTLKKQNQFVQDASHELRTPLTIIKAKQEKLLENPQTKIIDNVEDISITLQETSRLTKLISELMELAKNDSEKMQLNRSNFDVDKEIESMIKLYSDVAETQNKTILTKLNFNEKINIDLNKFKELLVILLDNSIKYTKEKDSIEVITYKKDNKFVLEIADTGIGISKDAIDKVFTRFYREEKSRNRAQGGMGLGLSIAYNIVNLHKGTIKFDKERTVGAKVIVKLPTK